MGLKKTSSIPGPERAPDPDVPEKDIPTIPDPNPSKAPPKRTDAFVFRDTDPRLTLPRLVPTSGRRA